MNRYHLTNDGRMLPCEATTKPCKYGNASHFNHSATQRILNNRPGNHREMTAWFNKRIAEDKRDVAPIKKRLRWGYNADFMDALLRVERLGDTKTANLLHKLRAKHGNPRTGGTRATFDRGDGHIIKVPLVPIAQHMSLREVGMYTNPNAHIPMAACWIETHDDVPVLIAEKVRELDPRLLFTMNLPAWVDDVDSYQVGYNRKGELVAYDL